MSDERKNHSSQGTPGGSSPSMGNVAMSDSTSRSGAGGSGENVSHRQAAKDVASEAGKQAGELRDKFTEESGKVGNELKDQAKSAFSESRLALADQVGRLAKAMRGSEKQLEDQDLDGLAPYPRKIADRIDEVSDYLREHKATELRSDLDRAISERPGLIVGSLAVAGALAVWYVKRDRERSPGSGRRRGSDRGGQ